MKICKSHQNWLLLLILLLSNDVITFTLLPEIDKGRKVFFLLRARHLNSCSLKTELGQQLNSEPSCLVLTDENNFHCYDSWCCVGQKGHCERPELWNYGIHLWKEMYLEDTISWNMNWDLKNVSWMFFLLCIDDKVHSCTPRFQKDKMAHRGFWKKLIWKKMPYKTEASNGK